MQGLCHLSRRWHQQFCRSPSFSGHVKCLQRWYHPSPISLARQRRGKQQPPPPTKATAIRQGDLVVREYEQDDENDPSTRRPIDHSQDPFVLEASYLKAEIQRLEEELDVMKEGPLGPNSEFMQSIPKDDREQLLKELEAEGLQYDSLKDFDIKDDFPLDFKGKDLGFGKTKQDEGQDLAVSMRIADRHKAWVGEFNKSLREARDKPDNLTAHVTLWKWYLRCHQKVPGFSSFVNEDVWQFLWQSQITTYPRTKHIIVLAKDMMAADVDLDHKQRLDYTDALHATGDTASAIQEWEKEKASIAEKAGDTDPFKAVANLDDHLANRFWATGVTLYTAVGRPAKAETIAFKSLEARGSVAEDGHAFIILVDVIRAWAMSQRDDADIKLWSCYMLMREKSSELSKRKDLPTGVLGQITSVLLSTGRRQMALAVFQDMLAAHTGNTSASNATLNQELSKALSVTDSSVANESIINQIGLTALLALPGKFKNKFFFGAWIKWLIGQDKIDDAVLVVELMQEQGVRPDARHLNGIIGAWLRSGSPAARDRAEQMAWAMIHARIDLVKSRSQATVDLQPLNETDHPHSSRQYLPVFLQRNIPPATIETFSVLLLRYTRSTDIARATQLTDILTGPAELKPNSFILNHWLNLSLRASDLNGMIARYQSTKVDVEPDLETFAILWDGCRRNLDRVLNTGSSNRNPRSVQYRRSMRYYTPRELFHEMRTWYTSLTPKEQSAVRDQLLQSQQNDDEAGQGQLSHTYDQIIRCFCLYTDLKGTYVALEQLNVLFGQLPREHIASMIVMQVARMLPPDEDIAASRPRRPAVKRRDEAYRKALGAMARVMQGVMDWKGAERVENAAAGAEMGAEKKAAARKVAEELATEESLTQRECRLDAIKTFIVLVLKRMRNSDAGVGMVVEEMKVAARGMGLVAEMDLDEEEVKRRVGEAKVFEKT